MQIKSLWVSNSEDIPKSDEMVSEVEGGSEFNYIHPIAAPSRITSEYNIHRDLNIKGKRPGRHQGIDITTPKGSKNRGVGTPIVAPIGGTVVTVRGSKSFGNYVEILGEDGYIHRLGHMDKHADNLKKGQQVSAGNWVGSLGSTGRSTGPHVHYEVRGNSDGSPVSMEQFNDPSYYAGGMRKVTDSRKFKDFDVHSIVLGRAKETRLPDVDYSGNSWSAPAQKPITTYDLFSVKKSKAENEAYRKGLEERNKQMSARAKEIRSELQKSLPAEKGTKAADILRNHMSSNDKDEREAGEYIYHEFGIDHKKKLNGIAARIAGDSYRAGRSRNSFFNDVGNGYPFWRWLNSDGSPTSSTSRVAWEKEKQEQDEIAADRATDVKMAETHGYMMVDAGTEDDPAKKDVVRAQQRGITTQYISEPLIKKWATDDQGNFDAEAYTKAFKVANALGLAGDTAPGVKDPKTGKTVGYWRSLQRAWQDLNIPFVGQDSQDFEARKAFHQDLGTELQSNYRQYLSQGRPEEYGFGPNEFPTMGGYVDPFAKRPGQGNIKTVDPSYDGIRSYIDDSTEETRAAGQDLVNKYKMSYIPAEVWSDDANRSGDENNEFSPEFVERIRNEEFVNREVAGMNEFIDLMLEKSLVLENQSINPKCSILSERKNKIRSLNEGGIVPLSEGGVAGHMNHLYDNPNLTFKEMKGIFRAASNGELKGTEKTDGQNLQLSYDIQTSSARAARNKGNIRDGGMDAAGLAAKFGGRGALETAFTEAFSAFEEAIGRMSIEEREEIFGPNTNIYYNAEVQDPRAANLINYDLPTLTIHRVGHREYDRETGSATDRDVSKNAKKLAMALGRVQGERQEGLFHVQMNAIRQLEALSDDTAANLAIARLEKALSNAGISDSQTVGEYVISKVDAVVDSRISLPVETKMELMKRMFKEPGANIRNVLGMIPKEDAGTIAVVRELVAEASALMTAAVAPIEEIVHDFSVEMLKGLHSAFILDNESEVERLRQETQRAITAIEGSNSEEAMEILAKQMSKLKDVEGVSTAAEGFVFDYDDVTYKFTGNFAPMNQLLGLFKYGRGNVPPMQKLDEEEGEVQINRTVAIVPGGFKPPHKGHLAMVDHYSKLSDIVFVFISPLSRGSKSDEAEVSFNQSKKIWNLYINSEGLGNVKIIDRPATFNSPVQMAYEFSENKKDEPYLAQLGDRILFGASEKADQNGNPDWMRFQNAQKYVRDGAIAGDPAEFASPVFFDGLSATDFRKALNNANVEEINQFLPQNVDSSEILSILGIGAEPESPIEEMSSMGGGAVEGGGSGAREPDSLIREEDGIIEEVLNYLLQKRNSHD